MEHEQNIDISVIIPIYNVSEFLIPCLESVSAAIHDLNIEVLLIDDGSTDDSGELARSYAESHPGFVFYHKENGGLGSARNYGIDRASGKYLMFLDSDDLVEPDIYDNLFAAAERTQSEIAICNVSRFSSKGSWPSGLHMFVFNDLSSEETTHITRCNSLVYSTIVCDKLISREFFLRNALRFPENHVLYEDIAISLIMLYLANHVTFIRKAEYLWRVREGESRSITQNTAKLKNLIDRLAALDSVISFYKTVPEQGVLKSLMLKAFRLDLIIFIDVLPLLSKKDAAVYMSKINAFIDEYLDKDLIRFLPIVQRQKYEYLFKNDLDGVIKTIRYGRRKHANTGVIRKGDTYFFDVPENIFTIEDKSAQYDFVQAEPNNRLDDFALSNGVLEIKTHLFHPKIEISQETDLTVEAALVGDVYGQKIPVSVQYLSDGAVTEMYGPVYNPNTSKVDHYNYDHSGFCIRIDLNELSDSLPAEDNYYFECKYAMPLCEGISSVRGVEQNVQERFERTLFATDKYGFKIVCDSLSRPFLRAEKLRETVTVGVDCDTDIVRVSGPGSAVQEYRAGDWECGTHRLGSYPNCAVRLDPAAPDLPAAKLKDGCVLMGRDKDDTLLLTKKKWLPVWEICDLGESEGTYRITVHGLREERALLKFYVYDKAAGAKRYLSECSVERAGECLQGSGQVHFDFDLMDGFYPVCAEIEGEPDEPLVLAGQQEYAFRIGDETFRLLKDETGAAVVQAFREWPEHERSAGEREYVLHVRYEKFRKEKVRPKTVLFESMWGTKYGNNPKAFYEYLDKHHPEYTCVWSFEDLGIPISGNGIKVRRGTEEYYRYLATAKYLVNDVNFENAFKKRGGQIMIETMHGTPYKTIGLDSKSDFPTKRSVETFIKKTMFWDYLVSQGKFLDDKAFGAYKFYKTILKTGYPRTDAIMQHDNERAESLKRQLNLPLDKKVILYAPTWRAHDDFELKLDLEPLMDAIGDEYVFALRIHHLSAAHFKSPADGIRVFDLTSFSNIEDLYQITDVLITDYSSVMFDFVLTGKPTVFYAYDLQEYEENLRGVYFDLRTEAPGPIAYTEEELRDVLTNLDRETERYEKRTGEFIRKYLSYENPNSSEKIFEQVFVQNRRSVKARFFGKIEVAIDHHLPMKYRKRYYRKKIHMLSRRDIEGKR